MARLAWIAFGLAILAASPAFAQPPTNARGDTIVYVVRHDETLIEIGHRALQPASAYRAVQELNHIGNDRRMPTGFHLIIPRALLRTTPILATVETVRGQATLAGGGELAAGRTLGEGSEILTAENAFVRLGLPDGSKLAIPSNSRVRLDRLRAVALTGGIDREISIKAGGVQSQVTPMRDPSSRFVVVTPVAQSAVRGTEFASTYDAAHQRATSSVLHGLVAVGGSKTEVLAHAGQGVVATPTGLKGPVALLAAPVLTTAARLQSGERLHFDLTPVPGAARYRVLVASDAAALSPLFEGFAATPSIEVPGLPDGAYFVRASAISADGLEGLPGVTPFTRLRGDLSIVGVARGQDGSLEFRWDAPGQTPPTYRFTLMRRDDREHPVIDREGLTEPRFTAPAPAPGDYAWRVSAIRIVGGRRVEVVSDPQPLHVP